MGYLASNGQCFATEIAAVSVTCNTWKNTFLTSTGNVQTEFCYNVYVPYVGSQVATIKLKNYVYSSNGMFLNYFQTSYSLDLLTCEQVTSANSSASSTSAGYRATPEEYQAVTVIFSAVLVALCVVWGFRQIIKIFATHPEA